MARPITPPPRKPVLELQTPNHRDAFYTELVNRDDQAYQKERPIKRGTPYQNITGAKQKVIDDYPGLFFLKEIKPGNSGDVGNTDQWVIWVWGADELAESVYNAEISMMEESTSHPRYVRDCTIRRKDYETAPTIAPGTPLTGMIGVTITNGGSNYTQASGTITGGATVEFVCFGGAIIYGIVTAEGASVTSGGSITITGNGTGATATARIQPASAVLVAQTKVELPKDDPRSHEFVLVRRIYETLPGPTITSWEHDPETDTFISTSRTKKLLSAITPGLVNSGADTVTITEKEAIDSIVGYEVVTVIPKGDFYSEATAQVEYKLRPFEFPGYIISYGEYGGVTLTSMSFFGDNVGARRASSDTVLHTIKTWWEIGTTPPTLTYDEISPSDIVINGQNYRRVLHDEMTLDYNGLPATIPATVPSFTEYYGTPPALTGGGGVPLDPFAPGTGTKWIGTERVIDGSVTRAGSKFRHKVQKITVDMR